MHSHPTIVNTADNATMVEQTDMATCHLHATATNNMPSAPAPEPKRWFVMRDLTRPNALRPAYVRLEEEHFEVFTPMEERLVVKHGKRIKANVPFIHDLLFVHSTRAELDPFVAHTSTLQYRFVKGKYMVPMVVGEEEMNRFVSVVQASNHPLYFRPEELTPAMLNRQVRIVGGSLDGCVGALKTRRGSKHRQLIVELPGLLAAGVDVTDLEFLALTDN